MQKAIIVLLISLVMGAPLYINFSEEAWHHTVTTTNPSLLYAPHFNNGKYFNPWNPMKDKSFRYFIPTQWGTFPLDEEPPGFPAPDLKRKIEHNKLNPEQFIIMNIGEVRVLKGK